MPDSEGAQEYQKAGRRNWLVFRILIFWNQVLVVPVQGLPGLTEHTVGLGLVGKGSEIEGTSVYEYRGSGRPTS